MSKNNQSSQNYPRNNIARNISLALAIGLLSLVSILAWLQRDAQLSNPGSFRLLSTTTPLFTDLSPTPSIVPQNAQIPNTSNVPPSSMTSLTVIPFTAVDEGLIVISMGEGGYSHLFAYQPGNLPFIRLTSGDWNDITPALSPDGNQLAFSSNRDGFWDLYLMELETGKITKLTDTPEYDSSPTWSPDGVWLAYESYYPSGEENDNLEILIRPLESSQEPIRLTSHPAADYAPAWSPSGRKIAFISHRSGESEVWLADLDLVEDRFRNLSNDKHAREDHPAWSPDGAKISWASTSADGLQNLVTWDSTIPGDRPLLVNTGDWAVWSPDGDALLTSVITPNKIYLSGYSLISPGLILPILSLEGPIEGLTWGKINPIRSLPSSLALAAQQTPTPIWSEILQPGGELPGGRQQLIPLQDVDAPNPMLQDRADDSFAALRERVILEAGWDFLATLEEAYIPLTTVLGPGMQEDWLYTGRAFMISPAPIDAGWMVVSREDYGPTTYWRIFLRTRFQDGSQGKPIHSLSWNLSARLSGDPRAYEEGGALEPIPAGYWLDFTQLAASYGWERLSALTTWRLAFTSTRFNEFVYRTGLDWLAAMMEVYPREALNTATPVPSPTNTLPPTLTPTKTLTPTRTPWLSRTPTPTHTPWPSRTPTPTNTPTQTLTPTPTPKDGARPN